MQYMIEEPKTESGVREIPMSEEVEAAFRAILAKRVKPKVEPMIDGYSGFLYLDKNNMPMVALHWEKYFQHINVNIKMYKSSKIIMYIFPNFQFLYDPSIYKIFRIS